MIDKELVITVKAPRHLRTRIPLVGCVLVVYLVAGADTALFALGAFLLGVAVACWELTR